jgi:hypothetical protein
MMIMNSEVIKCETRWMGPILRYVLSQHLNEETDRTNVLRLDHTVCLPEDDMQLVTIPSERSILPA